MAYLRTGYCGVSAIRSTLFSHPGTCCPFCSDLFHMMKNWWETASCQISWTKVIFISLIQKWLSCSHLPCFDKENFWGILPDEPFSCHRQYGATRNNPSKVIFHLENKQPVWKHSQERTSCEVSDLHFFAIELPMVWITPHTKQMSAGFVFLLRLQLNFWFESKHLASSTDCSEIPKHKVN